jgi:TolA-binding protein
MELALKLLLAMCSLVSVGAAIYNLATAHRRAKNLVHDNQQDARLEATVTLSIKNEQRINALEGRLGSFEQRIEHRIDQMAADITKVKDLFTDFLIKQKT